MNNRPRFILPECMNVHSEKGTKVRFSFPDNGRSYEQEKVKSLLTVGSIYTVEETHVFQSSTDVFLVEYPEIVFNSVFFENIEVLEK